MVGKAMQTQCRIWVIYAVVHNIQQVHILHRGISLHSEPQLTPARCASYSVTLPCTCLKRCKLAYICTCLRVRAHALVPACALFVLNCRVKGMLSNRLGRCTCASICSVSLPSFVAFQFSSYICCLWAQSKLLTSWDLQ